MGGMPHPKSDVDRVYIKRKNGGRGLLELEEIYSLATLGMNNYLQKDEDRYTKTLKEYYSKSILHLKNFILKLYHYYESLLEISNSLQY